MNSKTYRISLAVLLFSLTLFFCWVYFTSREPSEAAKIAYEAIHQDLKDKHEARKKTEEKEIARHLRKEVVRQGFLSQGTLRLEMQIQGEQSEIGVFSKRSNARVAENYDNAKGYVQEELYYVLADGSEVAIEEDGSLKRRDSKNNDPIPTDELKPMQLFRYFEAERAIYDFHSIILIAYNVVFWTYKREGHLLVRNVEGLKPLSSGSAKSLTTQYGGPKSKLQFSAENLKMELHPA